MFNSSILEVVIGMVFLYLLISLLCSAVKEMISQILKLRAKNLEAGLTNLLRSDKDQLVSEVYKHALIEGLSKEGGKPSYIPAKNFALALMDIMSGNTGKIPSDNASWTKAFKKGSFSKTRAAKAVTLLLNEAEEDPVKARENIENWYNNSMDRVGGWYKKKSQTIIFVLALMICVALNIDSIKISQALLTDKTLRDVIVSTAESYNTNHAPTLKNTSLEAATNKDFSQSAENIEMLNKQISDLKLPIGWQDPQGKWIVHGFTPMDWFMTFMGILITTFAVSLGAPFWFQLLNKIVDLRAAGKHDDSKKTS